MFSTLLQLLRNTLPSQCAICHAWPSEPLCANCLARHAASKPRCLRCALPLEISSGGDICGACLRQPPPLARCIAAVDYAFPWSGLIARYKFGSEPGWSASLAELMRKTPGAEDLIAAADALVPVPLATSRLSERGYNQALELAKQLDAGKTRSHSLIRLRDTPAQHSLPRKQRLTNLQAAFGACEDAAHPVAGRHLLLIDDVMTSGATLHAAAEALLAAGAAQVSALVLARTPQAGA